MIRVGEKRPEREAKFPGPGCVRTADGRHPYGHRGLCGVILQACLGTLGDCPRVSQHSCGNPTWLGRHSHLTNAWTGSATDISCRGFSLCAAAHLVWKSRAYLRTQLMHVALWIKDISTSIYLSCFLSFFPSQSIILGVSVIQFLLGSWTWRLIDLCNCVKCSEFFLKDSVISTEGLCILWRNPART